MVRVGDVQTSLRFDCDALGLQPLRRALALRDRGHVAPTRHDIALGGLLVFCIEHLLDPDEADAIVDAREQFGCSPEAPGIQTPPGMRLNRSVHGLADDGLMGPLYTRMAHLLPPTLDGAAGEHVPRRP